MPSHSGPLTVNSDSRVTADVPTGVATGKIVIEIKGRCREQDRDWLVSRLRFHRAFVLWVRGAHDIVVYRGVICKISPSLVRSIFNV